MSLGKQANILLQIRRE